jgi:hypothetical protein
VRMNDFIAWGMEVLWNGLRDCLIRHWWIYFCGVLWRTMSTSPRCRQYYMSSRHGSERSVQILIINFSITCCRRLNIGLMLLEPLVALTLNFINDKLLFIKLFLLVFQLVSAT